MRIYEELEAAREQVYSRAIDLSQYFNYPGDSVDLKVAEISLHRWQVKEKESIIDIIPTPTHSINCGEYDITGVFRGAEYTLIMLSANDHTHEDDPIIFTNSKEVKDEATQ